MWQSALKLILSAKFHLDRRTSFFYKTESKHNVKEMQGCRGNLNIAMN